MLEIVFEIREPGGDSRHGIDRRASERRAAKVRVQHHARRVQDAAQRWARGLLDGRRDRRRPRPLIARRGRRRTPRGVDGSADRVNDHRARCPLEQRAHRLALEQRVHARQAAARVAHRARGGLRAESAGGRRAVSLGAGLGAGTVNDRGPSGLDLPTRFRNPVSLMLKAWPGRSGARGATVMTTARSGGGDFGLRGGGGARTPDGGAAGAVGRAAGGGAGWRPRSESARLAESAAWARLAESADWARLAESAARARIASSYALFDCTRVTSSGVESARWSWTSAGCSGSPGSIGLSNVTRSETLSMTSMFEIAGGTVSRSIASSSTTRRASDTVTVVESHFSLRSSARLLFWSINARTVYSPAGSGPTSKSPAVSVAATYTMFVSGCETASTY